MNNQRIRLLPLVSELVLLLIFLPLMTSAFSTSGLSSVSPSIVRQTASALSFADKDNDASGRAIPFFLRGEAISSSKAPPPPPPVPYSPPPPNMDELFAKTKEVSDVVAEQVRKIDWEEVQSNVKAFAASDEVQTLKKTSVCS